MSGGVSRAREATAASRGRGRPRLMAEGARREAIVEAAIEAFARDGRHQASMDGIAEASKVAKPQIYELFASKDELYAAAVQAELEHLTGYLLDAYSGGDESPLRERTRVRIETVFAYAKHRPAGLRLLLSARTRPSPEVADQIERAQTAITNRLTELIRADLSRAGVESGWSDEVLAEALVELTIATAARSFERDDRDVDAVVELLTELIVNGLASMQRDFLEVKPDS